MKARDLLLNHLDEIKEIVRSHYDDGITSISRLICYEFNIKNKSGKIKDRAVRQFLYNLENKNIIILPEKRIIARCKRPIREVDAFESKKTLFSGDIKYYLKDILIKNASSSFYKSLWGFYISSYHYLNNCNLIGRTLKQIIFIRDIPVAVVGWSSPALHLKARDCKFIEKGFEIEDIIDSGISNSRFLVLPWVSVKNLCSHILSRAFILAKQYYKNVYGVDIFWADTFVDPSMFEGTIYKAANWDFVGYTQGFSKNGYNIVQNNSNKKIFLKLETNRNLLC